MIKHKKLPKSNLSSSFGKYGDLAGHFPANPRGCGSTSQDEFVKAGPKKKERARVFVLYRWRDTGNSSPEELTQESLFEPDDDSSHSYLSCFRSSMEDDWLLLGVLPPKIAHNYGGNTEYFSLTPDESQALQDEVVHFARERLLSYLAYQERSVSDCLIYLSRLPLNKKFADQLIKESIDKNYINDRRFAELLAASMLSRKKSLTEAKNSLTKKKISPQIIEETLNCHYTEENYCPIIDYHVKKAARKYANHRSYKDYQKCIAYMLRKGFPYHSFIERVKSIYQIGDE